MLFCFSLIIVIKQFMTRLLAIALAPFLALKNAMLECVRCTFLICKQLSFFFLV